MATTPTFDHALFTTPFSHCTDFTELADRCEDFISALIGSDDPVQKMALRGRLSTCLALLEPTLLEPVPAHLVESLTVDDIPAAMPAFEPESDSLTDWCQTLLQVLMSGALAEQQERKISELLCELVSFFAQTLKAPRWLRTSEGTLSLEENN